MNERDLAPWSIEYGVRYYGGHKEAKVSRHVAVREIEDRIANGEKNVWLVQRRVEDWQPVKAPETPSEGQSAINPATPTSEPSERLRTHESGCISCDEGDPSDGCGGPGCARGCGHHCNHAWTHDICCWCGRIWGEQ